MPNPADTDQAPGQIHENASRVVWALAWPAVALNSLQVINTLLDRGFIGHLQPFALTAHGGATNVMFLMFSLAVALSTGATALVSRAFGAGDHTEYRRSAQEAFSLAVFGGITVALVTIIISPFAASALLPATDVDAKKAMVGFLTAFALSLPPAFIINTLAGSLRGVGDTKSPMVISGVQIFLHMALNFMLIFPAHKLGGIRIPGADLGLTGAGTAQAISGWLATVAYVLYIPRTKLGKVHPFRLPAWDWSKRILRVAVPAGVMSTLRVFSMTAFTLVLKQVADASAAIAAMSVAFAIESIMFMPSFGLSAAAGALVGQSLGMKRPDRASRLGWIAGHYAALVTMILVTPIYIAAPGIIDFLVGGKQDIAQEATTLLRCLCTTEFLFGYAMVMIGSMQGAGDTVRPLWIMLISLWGLRLPLAILLALPTGFPFLGFFHLPVGLGMGAFGAWIAMASTQAIQGILSLIAFQQGKWKTARV